MAHVGKHAIVIGAGMGGLLAARALSDYFDEVTVFERDALPDASDPRKGVPQARHTHGLLARGREVLEQLFPGFTEQMIAAGAVAADLVNDGLWFNYGVYLRNAPSKMLGLGVSRPALECWVRRRLLEFPNIRVQQRHDVVEPVFARDVGRVTGVRVKSRAVPDGAKTINADLVVDASGRGSSSPAWLDAFGFAKPVEEQVTVNVGYAAAFIVSTLHISSICMDDGLFLCRRARRNSLRRAPGAGGRTLERSWVEHRRSCSSQRSWLPRVCPEFAETRNI